LLVAQHSAYLSSGMLTALYSTKRQLLNAVNAIIAVNLLHHTEADITR